MNRKSVALYFLLLLLLASSLPGLQVKAQGKILVIPNDYSTTQPSYTPASITLQSLPTTIIITLALTAIGVIALLLILFKRKKIAGFAT